MDQDKATIYELEAEILNLRDFIYHLQNQLVSKHLMPVLLIVNGVHTGIFSCEGAAEDWLDANSPDESRIVDINLFYKTDFKN